MDSVKCFKCKKDANKTSALFVCNYCNNYFHQTCFGLLPERTRFVRTLHQSVPPICSECDINTRIEILEARIKKLRRKLDRIVHNSPFETNEDFTLEVTDRVWRGKNIIVYNLPESLERIEISRFRDDTSRIIHEILSFCFIDVTNIRVRRLGVASSQSPRPLRVRLNREEDVSTVLRYKINCRSGLNFRPDRTPHQREVLKRALATVEDLHQQGYNNLQLKFFRGFPHLVQLDQEEEGQVLVADGDDEFD